MKYTTLNKIGLLTSLLGLILFPVSVYLQIIENDIFFSKIWISIILFFSGGLITVIDSGIQKNSKTIKISSNLTLFYKVIIGSILIEIIIFLLLMTIYSMITKSEMIAFWIIFTLITTGLFFFSGRTLLRLNFIEYDNNDLIISDFKKITKIKLENIIEITRYQLYFYRIKTNDSEINKIYFMPMIGQVFSTFMIGKPESIKKLINKINKKGNAQHTI